MRAVALFAGVAILTLVAITPVQAQDDGTTGVETRTNVISASPLLLMFKWFNVDYEHRISPTVTLGASGSYLPMGDGFNYERATVHARYYPQGTALRGFYMGVQTGLHRADSGHHGVLLGAGTDLGYAWLMGSKKNHTVSIGIGATRMFAGDLEGYAFTIPNVRLLNIGFAF
jgi:hypothetical protein